MKKHIRLVLIFIMVLSGQIGFSLQPFKSGERVVFLGDSITHYGRWWPYIWCAYVDRFPENPPLFFSAGFSGDTATGALRRLDRDVFSRSPDSVCVMFGMNDVKRSAYTAESSAEDRAAQKAALEAYRDSMDQLLRRITEKGLRCIVVTPSPYDQTMLNPNAGSLNPGCNDGLTIVSRIATDIAKKYHCDVVDFHAPMTRMNLTKQAQDPSSTIIGMDRIHPGVDGSKIMATLFLDAQGFDAAGVEDSGRYEAVWAHADLERNLRNIVWLDDRILKPKGIDLSNAAACREFIKDDYPHDSGGNKLRAASYLKWRGREQEIFRELEEIERRMKTGVATP